LLLLLLLLLFGPSLCGVNPPPLPGTRRRPKVSLKTLRQSTDCASRSPPLPLRHARYTFVRAEEIFCFLSRFCFSQRRRCDQETDTAAHQPAVQAVHGHAPRCRRLVTSAAAGHPAVRAPGRPRYGMTGAPPRPDSPPSPPHLRGLRVLRGCSPGHEPGNADLSTCTSLSPR